MYYYTVVNARNVHLCAYIYYYAHTYIHVYAHVRMYILYIHSDTYVIMYVRVHVRMYSVYMHVIYMYIYIWCVSNWKYQDSLNEKAWYKKAWPGNLSSCEYIKKIWDF